MVQLREDNGRRRRIGGQVPAKVGPLPSVSIAITKLFIGNKWRIAGQITSANFSNYAETTAETLTLTMATRPYTLDLPNQI